MVKGKGIMFYIHYDEDGMIISIANHKHETYNNMEISLDIFNEFNTLKKQVHEYKIVNDLTIKGKTHIIPIHDSDATNIIQDKGIVSTVETIGDGITFEQRRDSWKVHCNISNNLSADIASRGNNFRKYFIVDKNNKFILIDTLDINLKELVQKDYVEIPKTFKYSNVAVVSNPSSIQHAQLIGKYDENN
jgi:hypothetical protein